MYRRCIEEYCSGSILMKLTTIHAFDDTDNNNDDDDDNDNDNDDNGNNDKGNNGFTDSRQRQRGCELASKRLTGLDPERKHYPVDSSKDRRTITRDM